MGKKKRGAQQWSGYDPNEESEEEAVNRLYKEQETKNKGKTNKNEGFYKHTKCQTLF